MSEWNHCPRIALKVRRPLRSRGKCSPRDQRFVGSLKDFAQDVKSRAHVLRGRLKAVGPNLTFSGSLKYLKK